MMKVKTLFMAIAGAFVSLLLLASPAAAQKACSSDSICAKGEICAPAGSRNICVPGCRTSGECGGGKVCINNQCTTTICTPGTSRSCFDGPSSVQNVGTCSAGIQYCLAGGESWSACTGQSLPQAERCDGLDNDCNGRVDDGITCDCRNPGSIRNCYTGPAGTVDVGICRAGQQSCRTDNTWSACIGEVLPVDEIRDGLDNDCDGQVDERGFGGTTGGDLGDLITGPGSSGGGDLGDLVTGPGSSGGLAGTPFVVQVPWRTENIAQASGAVLKCRVLDEKCGLIDEQQLTLQKGLNVTTTQRNDLLFNHFDIGFAAMVMCFLSSAQDPSLVVTDMKLVPGKMATCR